ncbi:MAG: hypothetical protein AB2A00_20065 [Myxococcota bacterium]
MMRRLVVGMLVLTAACLPRDNPFDRADIEDAYAVRISAQDGLTVHFSPLSGAGLKGYRIYREDHAGNRRLVSEVPADVHSVKDEDAPAALALAEQQSSDATLYYRVAGVTSAGDEGPISRRSDEASTRILPDTVIDPAVPEYITGVSGVAVVVNVSPPKSGGESARHFRYRFVGGEWGEPILAGPLVLTGLRDGRYTLEAAAVGAQGDLDLTPATASFTYDFNVPEGTSCVTAVCSEGLACVEEPVGRFCRRVCGGADAGSVECPVGTECRANSGAEGEGACVVVAALHEACHDRLCATGLICTDAGDGRSLCGDPCGDGNTCTGGRACLGTGEARGCLPQAAPLASCANAACTAGHACEDFGDDPTCRRICDSQGGCEVGELCQDLGRADLKICR